MLLSRFVVSILSIVLLGVGAGVASGQDYPSKTIRILTAGAGGASDMQTRQIAQGISGPLGQAVIVDNRSGILAAEAASKAPPDGYTLNVAGATLWISTLMRKMPYEVVRDFSPISLISRDVNVIAVHPSVPAKSIREFIALARARPGELNYATGAAGSTGHLATELFKDMARINIVWIPHKGSIPAITAVMAGDVHLIITGVGDVAAHVKSGRLRALAVTSVEPSALAPGLPTVAASGLPGYESVGMTGIFAPAKTPGVIINRLNQEIVRFLRTAEAKEAFFNAGAESADSSPEQFGAMIRYDMAKMGKLIKDVGIKVE